MLIYGEHDEVVPPEQATTLDIAMRALHRAPVTIIHKGGHLDGISSQMFTRALEFVRGAPPLHAGEAETPR
jgi:hypothetical protein